MYYDPNYIEWGTPNGWRCPGCGRYYSPTTPMCFYCGGNQRAVPFTTTFPSINDSEWWEEYLKQNTTGHPSTYYEDLNKTISAAKDSGINTNITQETANDSVSTITQQNISHRKPLETWIDTDILDSFIKYFKD